jgi:SHS2 domain-containing protein
VSHRWAEHTAELELHLEAASEEQVFVEALEALAELLGDGTEGEKVTFDVDLEAADDAALLAAWIDELVFRAETEDLVPDRIERLSLARGRLVARVCAHRAAPRHVVKGTTYHRLALTREDGGFRACVVLDV